MSLSVSHLSFSYEEDHPVLSDLSFTIGDGRMVCLLGPNGAGKSTLFKTILRLLPNYEGEIFLDGVSTRGLSIAQMAHRIAYIPQSGAPTFNYTMFEMVLMGTTAGLSRLSSPGERQREMVKEAMQRLGIWHLADRGFARVSGGERQLALIARALVQETRVLIMDEPTANLDYGNAIRVLEQIRQLAGSGYTILQATHQPDQAFLFADEVLALKDGRILAQGSPREVIDSRLIETLYGVHVAVERLYDDRLRVLVPVSALRDQDKRGGPEEGRSRQR
ncbi:MAG: ABC transporter ATP-binding protein [Eubacteriales bacterium]|nr:ABC transporter ATP-binding protein [Eubacteriales bacterium]